MMIGGSIRLSFQDPCTGCLPTSDGLREVERFAGARHGQHQYQGIDRRVHESQVSIERCGRVIESMHQHRSCPGDLGDVQSAENGVSHEGAGDSPALMRPVDRKTAHEHEADQERRRQPRHAQRHGDRQVRLPARRARCLR